MPQCLLHGPLLDYGLTYYIRVALEHLLVQSSWAVPITDFWNRFIKFVQGVQRTSNPPVLGGNPDS